MNETRYRVRIAAAGRTIVQADDFRVPQGVITFLFGESGIGKSLLCKTLYGLMDPDELDISVNDRPYRAYLASPEAREVRASSFCVFQEPSSHLNPLMRLGEQLDEGDLAAATGEEQLLARLWQSSAGGAVRRIIDVYPKPYRPSGGEKQRILIAMAFKKMELWVKGSVQGRSFYVFDEATGSLDNNYRNIFLSLLFEQYARRPFTAMVITHDYSMIGQVYAAHKASLPGVRFKELSRVGEAQVDLHDFSPQEYLDWIARAQPPAEAAATQEPVLQMDPDFTVFGRRLRIHADLAHRQPRPLAIRRGEMVYVKAPSGVGKTTLAKVVMGLYHADAVRLRLAGADITQRTPVSHWERRVWGRRAGMVFQHADESLDLEARVGETFSGLPLRPRLAGEALVAKLSELFEGIDVRAFLRRKVKYLSGGQKQRLNLLRTLVLNTDLVVLDEPLNGLDFAGGQRVLRLIDERRREGCALLLISHNEDIFDKLVAPGSIYHLAEVGAAG